MRVELFTFDAVFKDNVFLVRLESILMVSTCQFLVTFERSLKSLVFWDNKQENDFQLPYFFSLLSVYVSE